METHNSKLHFVMFPWIAFGHFIPFLHLSNKLAQRGHKVSYILPNKAQPKLQHLNRYPNLITFIDIVIPHVDGLPVGTQTASDVPLHLHDKLLIAFDQTQDQVETIVTTISPNPHYIFFDLAPWIPELTRRQNQHIIVSLYYSVVSPATLAYNMVPARKVKEDMTLKEYMTPPLGYPSSTVVLKRYDASRLLSSDEHGRNMVCFYNRVTTGLKESDVIAIKTYNEVDGKYCDYLADQYKKQVLLTGPILQDKQYAEATKPVDAKWVDWLKKFESKSVVYCAFGSQVNLKKDQFQEMVLGFELSGHPFLVALAPPEGCSSVEEALPDGFQERTRGIGLVYGGWVPQPVILNHPSVGCFVSHCGYGSLWESLVSECQIVVIPQDVRDYIMGTRLLVDELKVAMEVERDESIGWITKENLSRVINIVMDKENESGKVIKTNHAKLNKIVCSEDIQENYLSIFIDNLQKLFVSKQEFL